MTTIRKTEDVKKGLRCCIVRNPDERRKCPECPYRDPEAYCTNRLMNDALTTIEMLSGALDALTEAECSECEIEEVP